MNSLIQSIACSLGDGILKAVAAKAMPLMLWCHDSHQPIGVWTEIVEDRKGLKVKGKLVQLVHVAEVLETGGLIDWQRISYALASAINAWAAKGSIDLSK